MKFKTLIPVIAVILTVFAVTGCVSNTYCGPPECKTICGDCWCGYVNETVYVDGDAYTTTPLYSQNCFGDNFEAAIDVEIYKCNNLTNGSKECLIGVWTCEENCTEKCLVYE